MIPIQLLNIANQFHIFHFQTRLYSEHKLFQKIYESFRDYADRIVEATYYDEPLILEETNSVNLGNFEPSEPTNILIDLRTEIVENLNKSTVRDNVYQDLLEDVNKFLFLLTLK